nr:hypothetical protein [Akkermansiaceae bacterium]
MAVHTYPVLLWRHADGAVGGALVGDYRNAAARGADEREVLKQFADLLAWRANHEPWSIDPDLLDPRLLEIKVEVRAQYQDATRHRLIPAPDTTLIRVPCVIGKAENGMPVCEIPTLEIRFHFQDEHQVRDLAGHFVKEALSNKTPAALACLLPPRGTWLEQVSVKVTQSGNRRPPVGEREEFKTLFAVGEPLLHGGGSKSAAYGRDEEVMTLVSKLVGERSHILLVGEPGCGKTTVLMDAARRMARLDAGEDEDRSLRSWRCWRVSGARIIAGLLY